MTSIPSPPDSQDRPGAGPGPTNSSKLADEFVGFPLLFHARWARKQAWNGARGAAPNGAGFSRERHVGYGNEFELANMNSPAARPIGVPEGRREWQG